MSDSTSSESTSPSGNISTPASTPATISRPSTPLACPKTIPVADRTFFAESDLLQQQSPYYRGPPNETMQPLGRGLMPTPPMNASFQEMRIEQPGEEEFRGAEILYKIYLKDTASKLKQAEEVQIQPVHHIYPEPHNIPPPEQAHTRDYTSPRAIYKPDGRRPMQYHWTMPTNGYAHVGIEYSELGHARLLHRPFPEMYDSGQIPPDSEEARRMWAEYQARHWGYP